MVNGEFTIGFNYTELCKEGSVVQLRDVETNTLVQCLEISMDNGVIILNNSEYYHDLFEDQEIKFVHESDYAAMK